MQNPLNINYIAHTIEIYFSFFPKALLYFCVWKGRSINAAKNVYINPYICGGEQYHSIGKYKMKRKILVDGKLIEASISTEYKCPLKNIKKKKRFS